MKKSVSILSLLPIAVAMFTMPGLACGADETNSAPKVSVKELLRNKEQWKGKRVEVSGFYVARFEVSALYESELDARSTQDAKSLWVDYYDEAPPGKGKLKWVERGLIRIIGTFDFRPDLGSGHLNQWPARIKRIELVEPIEASKPKSSRGASQHSKNE